MSFPENPPPVADIEWLRELAQEYRDNPQLDREYVFSSALLGFYDSMWEGLNKTTGNVVYRLSDYIPKKERERMLIYPNSNGSLVSNGNPWDSLEDWRRQWEKTTASSGGIPFFHPQLQSGLEKIAGLIESRLNRG